MQIKNAILYSLDEIAPDADAIRVLLAQKPFAPAGALEASVHGWVAPMSDEGDLLEVIDGRLILAMRSEEKIAPQSSVRTRAAEIIKALEATEGRDVGRAEAREIQDRVLTEMLPHAPTRRRTTWGIINAKDNLLIVTEATSSKAEVFTKFLRDTLGTLSVTRAKTDLPMTHYLTRWVQHGETPARWTVEDQATFEGQDGEGVIAFRNHDLGQQDVLRHLENGMRVKKLALSITDTLTFKIDDNITITGMQLHDVQQEADDALDDAGMALVAIRAIEALRADLMAHEQAERFTDESVGTRPNKQAKEVQIDLFEHAA